MDNKLDTLKSWIENSDNVVFFGGAGVSTESNVPDFRSADGLYNQKYAYPPETIISHSFYMRNPKEFYRFYKDRMLYPQAKPNPAHLALAKLEKEGRLKAVITQNIDGLHQAAGSRNVLEIHGTTHKYYCQKCGKEYNMEYVLSHPDIPTCECGGTIRPDIVLYDESLDWGLMYKAGQYIRKSDVLIVGGTSLSVYPAAGLINNYRGRKLVMISMSKTDQDHMADLIIRQPIGEVMRMFL